MCSLTCTCTVIPFKTQYLLGHFWCSNKLKLNKIFKCSKQTSQLHACPVNNVFVTKQHEGLYSNLIFACYLDLTCQKEQSLLLWFERFGSSKVRSTYLASPAYSRLSLYHRCYWNIYVVWKYNLESRRQQYTVRRTLAVESFPMRLQLHTQIPQLCQRVSRTNLHKRHYQKAISVINFSTRVLNTALSIHLLCRRSERSLASHLASQEGQQLHTWSGISFQHDAAATAYTSLQPLPTCS